MKFTLNVYFKHNFMNFKCKAQCFFNKQFPTTYNEKAPILKYVQNVVFYLKGLFFMQIQKSIILYTYYSIRFKSLLFITYNI